MTERPPSRETSRGADLGQAALDVVFPRRVGDLLQSVVPVELQQRAERTADGGLLRPRVPDGVEGAVDDLGVEVGVEDDDAHVERVDGAFQIVEQTLFLARAPQRLRHRADVAPEPAIAEEAAGRVEARKAGDGDPAAAGIAVPQFVDEIAERAPRLKVLPVPRGGEAVLLPKPVETQPAQHLRRVDAGGGREAVGKPAKPQLRVRLPQPVGAGRKQRAQLAGRKPFRAQPLVLRDIGDRARLFVHAHPQSRCRKATESAGGSPATLPEFA
jgi:hypothetical protein